MIKERTSQDKIVNDFGKKLVSFCRTTNIRIVNGRLGADKGKGEYTRIENEQHSTVDYLLADPQSATLIADFDIRKGVKRD